MSDTAYPSVNDLTLEEKASLTSGGDAWHLQGVESKGIPGYMITDGPHGLRKSLASSTGETDLNDSVPATCFPPAAGLSSSWNPELIHKVGEAMAEECIQEKVAVILGPGVNIKRNPLGGAYPPTSPSGRCVKSTSRPSNTSSRPHSPGPSCAPTTASTACIPHKTAGCSPTCCATNGGMKASS